MATVKRLIRDKRGMSDVFAGLFFIILILMGFNAMLWSFAQFDSYDTVITSMNSRDQQASSENLVPTAPGAEGFSGDSFEIAVNNTGTVQVSVVTVYILNVNPIGSSQCKGSTECIINPSSPINCAGNGSCTFTNGNVKPGEHDHLITVTGLTINDGSDYQVVLATARGRQFSFYYPWPTPKLGPGPSNNNSTNTDHGPLDVQIAVNSFNFTMDSWTTSQPAWTVPYDQNLVFWIKITNNALYPITLNEYSLIYTTCNPIPGAGQMYGSDCEDTQTFFIVGNSTINPSHIVAYNDNAPITLPAAGPSGPNGATIVKFGAFTPSGTQALALDEATPYAFWLILYYTLNGQVVGQALNYITLRACATYPSCT
jgi:hypothetical protein